MTILWLITSALLLGMLGVSLWNAASAVRLRTPAEAPLLRASLLVPVRNEAVAVAATLRSAVRHAPGAGILVLDDESTDGTSGIVRQLQWETEGRVQLLAGEALPPGWIGKNWACHQLAARAAGDVLIFCDADVSLTGDAVSATLALMERSGADVLTAMPAHEYSGWWDRALLPLLLHFPVLGTLPLPLVTSLRSRALVFGNGQWIAFTRAAYQRIGGHEAVRDSIIEDMALVRRARQLGMRVLPVLARDLLRVRMYRSAPQLLEGFAKNLYPLLGGHPLPALALLFAFTLATAAPLALAANGRLLPLALLLAVRALHARLTGGSARELLLHPIGVVLAWLVALRSAHSHLTGRVTWKERSIAWNPVS